MSIGIIIFVYCIAVYGLSNMIVFGSGPFKIFEKIREWSEYIYEHFSTLYSNTFSLDLATTEKRIKKKYIPVSGVDKNCESVIVEVTYKFIRPLLRARNLVNKRTEKRRLPMGKLVEKYIEIAEKRR